MAEETKVSKAQQKAVNKYIKNNYDRINVTFPKGEKEKIKAHAQSGGESVNAFIIRAVRETLERESVKSETMKITFPDIRIEENLPESVLEALQEVKIEPEAVLEALPEVQIDAEPISEAIPMVQIDAEPEMQIDAEPGVQIDVEPEVQIDAESVFVPMNQGYKELLKAEYGYSNEEMEELMQPVIEKKSRTPDKPASAVAIDPIWTKTVFPEATFQEEERLDSVILPNSRQEDGEEGGESLENMIERLCREHMMTAKKLKK